MSTAVADTLPRYSFSLTKARVNLREQIERFGKTILHDEPVEAPIRHYFAAGLFAREISIRAGCQIVGAVHKQDSLIVLSKGRLIMATEDGPKEIAAPHTHLCKAGTQNAVYVLEDCVWTNFHPNPDNETDIAALVQRYTEATVDQLIGGKNNAQVLAVAQRKAEIEASS